MSFTRLTPQTFMPQLGIFRSLLLKRRSITAPVSVVNHNFVKYSSQNKDEQTKTSLTTSEKFKKAFKEYGSTVIVFHITISVISLGSCYCIVSSGVNVEQLLITLGLDNLSEGKTALVSNAGTFAVAYAVHKVFAPVRIGLTLTCAPLIVGYLRNKGILKK